MSDRAMPQGCPDPSVLAAFVEGVLDAESRREVERHLAGCPECPLVIAETSRFLDSDVAGNEADPRHATHRRWWVAAAIAALCLTALVWRGIGDEDRLQELKRVAAQSPVRTIEGRLAGFAYAPFSKTRSAQSMTAGLALRAAAARVVAAGDDAPALHARGVALLLSGKAPDGAAVLARAASADPGNADLWNDLAAAHLAAATATDTGSIPTALAAADRAVALDPSSSSANFNRALAHYHLGRYAEAARDFRRVLELEPRSPWGHEAQTRLSRLQH